MYGIINKAVEVFVSERFGHEVWNSVLAQARQTQPSFVSALRYDDQTTFDLIAAAAEVSHLPEPFLLEELGLHWMNRLFVAFPEMIRAEGASFRELLDSLPVMRARVLLLFPGSNPPRFLVAYPEPGLCHITYVSGFSGLTPLVRGMIRGLAEHCGTPADVSYLPSRKTFVARWSEE